MTVRIGIIGAGVVGTEHARTRVAQALIQSMEAGGTTVTVNPETPTLAQSSPGSPLERTPTHVR
jgi:hypothetical protein